MEAVEASLYDGTDARRHPVSLSWDDAGLALAGEGIAERIDWPRLACLDILPDARILGRADRADWRLKLPVELPESLAARLPRPPRFGRWIDRFGFVRSLACLATIGGLAAFSLVSLPGWLGHRIPISWEMGMSDDDLGDLAASTCHTPASDAALAALVGKLDRDAIATQQSPVRIDLVRIGLLNAVALPGGRILLFDGLVQNVRSPEALAGVVAHEIGHVRQRHVMQAMLRQFGISMILSGFKSGITNTLGQMTAMRFSRDAETEADAWSRDRLARANISPVPTADFFELLARAQDYAPDTRLTAYLASHPVPAERERAFRNAVRAGHAYRPALDDAQFAAIIAACRVGGGGRPARS